MPYRKKPTPMGLRIRQAIDLLPGETQSSVEARLIASGHMSSRGQLSSLVTGRRGTHTASLETVAALTDILGVTLDWLVKGRGPMRAVMPLDSDSVSLSRLDEIENKLHALYAGQIEALRAHVESLERGAEQKSRTRKKDGA